jgi:ATP-dependent helicase HrpA
LLSQLTADQLLWSIPGWQLETITAALRALPKELRKHFVPVPDAAARCFQELKPRISVQDFASWVTRESGQEVSSEQVKSLPLPEHLRLNLRVVRLDGKYVTEGRDLTAVRKLARNSIAETTPSVSNLHREWDFGDLPREQIVERKGVKFTVYPALRVQNDGVAISECGSQVEAESISWRGIVRLGMLTLPQQAKLARQQFKDRRELVLLGQTFGAQRSLAEDFVERVFHECFFSDQSSMPRTRDAFQARLDAERANIGATIERVAQQVVEILTLARSIRQTLGTLLPAFREAKTDIELQLSRLATEDFLISIPNPWFGYSPRYLRAIQRRLERLPGNARRDAEIMKSIAPFAQAVQKLNGKSGDTTELNTLRWMLEEYRVSLFAQDLKTAVSVSEKRLAEQLARAIKETNT